MNFLKKSIPDVLCLIIAVPCAGSEAVPVISSRIGNLIGMILTLILTRKEPFAQGINYTSKKILGCCEYFLDLE